MPLRKQGPFGCRIIVLNFTRIVWTVFEKFEIFMKGREKKQHDCLSSRKFFPTPKNEYFRTFWNFCVLEVFFA